MLQKKNLSLLLGIFFGVIGVMSYLSFPLIYPSSGSSNVNANVVVSSACFIGISPNSITFGNMAPTSAYDTNVLVTDTDNGGNVAANILLEGTTWASGSNTFAVGQTNYNGLSQSSYLGVSLTTSLVDTAIQIPAPTVLSPSTSNTVYFGLEVPGGTTPGTYTQTITFENSC
jgi:hypothetical protein